MFKIGEFSKIAQVPSSLLRYYDEIGLLKPIHSDPQSGYRFYSATQLSRLNQIMALKDLGLNLEQIARLLDQDPSAEEIRGMLTLKKSQLEQSLQGELARLRSVETRISQLERHGQLGDYDVILKPIPAKPFLSYRETYATRPQGLVVMWEMLKALPETAGRRGYGPFTIVFHYDALEETNLDIEMGYPLEESTAAAIQLPDHKLSVSELPGATHMATLVRHGWVDQNIPYYAALGEWVEQNGYQLAGPGREVMIVPPQPGQEAKTVSEIQLPVVRDSPLSLS